MSDIMDDQSLEDLSDFVSPPSLPIDITSVDAALTIPVVTLLIAISNPDGRVEEYLSDPSRADLVPVIDALRQWIADNVSQGTFEEWADYLTAIRAQLIDSCWTAYDPDGVVTPDVRDMIGDELVGTALFARFLFEVGVIDEEDERRLSNAWMFILVNDLLGLYDDDDESNTEPVSQEDEW